MFQHWEDILLDWSCLFDQGRMIHSLMGPCDLASGEWPRMLMFLQLVALGRHSPRLVMLI
jgi:hypothetical protein